jgi:rhodanese-related sulfurtransferase
VLNVIITTIQSTAPFGLQGLAVYRKQLSSCVHFPFSSFNLRFRGMPFPKEPVVVQGGCNCGAYHFQVSVPAWESRPQNPYRIPGSVVERDPRIPMTTIDHCNDCRRATGALLPMALVTDISWVTATCLSRSDQQLQFPASTLFDFEKITSFDVFLTFYKSSPARTRWFCSRCGTHLAYTVDPGAIPEEWGWPKMLDIWLGSIDRTDLEKDFMAPERQLWCQKGIPWVRDFARRGGDGIPEHPTTKINEVIDSSRSIAEVLEDARAHLIRVTPKEALSEFTSQSQDFPVILVDIRPAAQRESKGMIGGALIIERNVLEWRLDPRSDSRLSVAGRYDLRIIVFCQESYTSSLAAKALQELGLKNATDMVGGYRDWKEAGLPPSLIV